MPRRHSLELCSTFDLFQSDMSKKPIPYHARVGVFLVQTLRRLPLDEDERWRCLLYAVEMLDDPMIADWVEDQPLPVRTIGEDFGVIQQAIRRKFPDRALPGGKTG